MAGTAAVEEELIALLGDFEPGAENVAPAKGAADGETEVFSREGRIADEKGDGAA
jgi:hypothetical protein